MNTSYAFSQTTYKADEPTPDISRELIHNVDKSLTKGYREILEILYATPNLTQKSLCAQLGKNANSLSNMLARIHEINSSLIKSTKSGRENLLSLGPIGMAYMQSQEAPSDTNKIRSFSNSARDEMLKNVLESLDGFKQLAPDSWEMKLDNFLVGCPEENVYLCNAYNKLINNIQLLRIKGYQLTLQNFFDNLGNNILVHRIQNVLNQSLKHFYQLETLFNLANAKPQSAFEIIDDMFLRIYPDIFSEEIPDISSTPHKNLFSEEKYSTTFFLISNMVHSAVRNHQDKVSVIQHWEELFCTTNVIFYYIAEKCQTIQLLQNQANSTMYK